MKGLSLLQPFASLIAIGAKHIESRSWQTPYRGPLAIAASKGFPVEDRELCDEWPFDKALRTAGFASWRDLPRGAIVAVCTLVTCRTTAGGSLNFFTMPPGRYRHWEWRLEYGPEYYFGDYSPHRYGWLLDDIKALPEPIPCKGTLGLWDVSTDAVMAINEQIGRGAA